MAESVKRRYRSPLREEQARSTRSRIVAAAQELFFERGYVRTTMRDVASEAGVAERTVYLVFESKRQVLFAVIDAAIRGDADSGRVAEADWFRDVLDEPDPRRQIVLFARAVRKIHERTWRLVEVLQTAAAVDPEVAEMWRAHARGQVEDERLVIQSLAAKGALRAGLLPATALDTVWALTTPLFYAQVSQQGWSPSRYELWLRETLTRLLLDD